MKNTPDQRALWDSLDIESTILDEALNRPRIRLTKSGAEPPDPAVYLVFYRPKAGRGLDTYRLISDGCYPVYAGSALDGRERLRRHRLNTKPVRNLHGGADLIVSTVALPTLADALFAESVLIRHLQPLFNTIVRGFGSRHQGRTRRSQAPPPFSILHPGRRVGTGEPTVTTAFLRRQAIAHLEATVVPGLVP
jgi:hypothetical protein